MEHGELRNPENMRRICELTAAGRTLRQIARELGCANPSIAQWISGDAEFAKQYSVAKQIQAENMAEELIDISDDAVNDWMSRETEDGGVEKVLDKEHIQRSRLRVDTRKWLMSKMLPKKYGDRQQVELSGEIGVRQMSDSVLDDRIVQGLVASGMSEEAARAYVARDKGEGP